MKKDLTTVKGTMTYVITNNSGVIREAYEDENITLDEFKSIVIGVIMEAKMTKSCKLAIANINSKKSKENVLFYVYNVGLAGSNNAVLSYS